MVMVGWLSPLNLAVVAARAGIFSLLNMLENSSKLPGALAGRRDGLGNDFAQAVLPQEHLERSLGRASRTGHGPPQCLWFGVVRVEQGAGARDGRACQSSRDVSRQALALAGRGERFDKKKDIRRTGA